MFISTEEFECLNRDAARWRFIRDYHLQYFEPTKRWRIMSDTGEVLVMGAADSYKQAVDQAMAVCAEGVAK